MSAASSRRSVRRLFALAFLAAVVPSCNVHDAGGGGSGDPFDRTKLLGNLADNLILPAIQDFAAQAGALQAAVGTWADDVGNVMKRDAARSAWIDAMESWQTVELLQFGPAGSSADLAGGMDLRTYVYSWWQAASACRVDEVTQGAGYTNPDFFDLPLTYQVNAYGLDALEYLLFHELDTNACGVGSTINQGAPPTPWDTLVLSGNLPQQRADYAEVVCGGLVTRAQQLLNEWLPLGNNFVATFKAGTSPYASAHDAVNDVFAGMFYVDLGVKDRKLGRPSGLTGGTVNPPDPTLVESRWSGTSKEQVLKNLEIFRFMFLGNGPSDPVSYYGFDDFLVSRGGSDLASQMLLDIDAAVAAVNAIPGKIEDAVQDPSPGGGLEKVRAAHAAVKLLTDELKSQFVTILNLSVPSTGAGDND